MSGIKGPHSRRVTPQVLEGRRAALQRGVHTGSKSRGRRAALAVGFAGRLLLQVPAARALDGLGHRVPGLTPGAPLHPGDGQVRLEEEVEPAVGQQQGDLQDV